MADALKDMFDRAWVGELGVAVAAVHPPFDADRFASLVVDDAWEARELKQRMRHIAVTLGATLPDDYPAAIGILRAVADALGPIGFKGMVFPDFVEVHGLGAWDVSIAALEHLTQHSSAEYAIRPFLLRDPTRGMAQMLSWASHENEHVRRLATEGCRPRLPWATALPALKADPSPLLPVLDLLRDDRSEYVRRSVANNLNDIAKDHPDVVVDMLGRWLDAPTAGRVQIARHGLRTLVKAGHPEALSLLGFAGADVTATSFTLGGAPVPFGGELGFSVTITSHGADPQRLAVDYLVEFARQGGKVGRKVFKLTTLTLAPGGHATFDRRFSFRPISTRRYYPGPHAIEIQANGVTLARREFTLAPPEPLADA